MPYTQQQAIDAIQAAINDPDAVIAILGDLETGVTIPESVLFDSLDTMSRTLVGKTSAILYSGGSGQSGVYAKLIAQADSTVAIIDDTNAARLLFDDVFKSALLASVGQAQFDDLLFGTTTNGLRNPDSLWDDISRDFVTGFDANITDVRTVTMEADAYRVFAQTELPALLNNTNIQTINGISKTEFQDYFDGRKAFHLQTLSEPEAAAAALKDLNNDFVIGTSAKINVELDPDFANSYGTLTTQQIDDLAASGKILKTLAIAGTVGDVLGLMIAAHDANAALDNDDPVEAANIMTQYGAELGIGAYAGLQIAGLTANTVGIQALAKIGTPGKVAAAILVGASGLFGAVAGGEAAKAVVDRIFEAGKGLGVFIDDFVEGFGLALSSLSGGDVFDMSAWHENYRVWFGVDISNVWDPVVIDLDGDGIETIARENGVYFDFNANGIAEAAGWLEGDDGFLVRDLNANGQIDDGGEMFGSGGVDGFTALAAYDENGDGVINASDTGIWNSLQIWRDLNGDGFTQSDELFSLASLNCPSSGYVGHRA